MAARHGQLCRCNKENKIKCTPCRSLNKTNSIYKRNRRNENTKEIEKNWCVLYLTFRTTHNTNP